MPIPLAALAIGSSLIGGFAGNSRAKKAEKLQQQSLDMAKRDYDDRQPFRDAASQYLTRKIDPNVITSTFADPGNPYATNNAYQSPWQPQAPIERAPVDPNADQRAALTRLAGNGSNMISSFAKRGLAQLGPSTQPPIDRARILAAAQTMGVGR